MSEAKICKYVLTKRQSILGPLYSAGEVSNNTAYNDSTPLWNEGILWRGPEELLLSSLDAVNWENWKNIGLISEKMQNV